LIIDIGVSKIFEKKRGKKRFFDGGYFLKEKKFFIYKIKEK